MSPVLALVLGWAVAAAAADLRWRRIPNSLTFGAMAVAGAWLLATRHSLLGGAPTSALMAAALALGLTVPAYAMGKLGAGDAKLLAAMGLAGDVALLIDTFVLAAVAGGLMAVGTLCAPRIALGVGLYSERTGRWLYRLAAVHPKGRTRLPYGVALAFGFVVNVWMTRGGP